MKDDMAKAISIAAIWISTALIFIFGIFDYQVTTDVGSLIMILSTSGMIGICFVATLLVLRKVPE